MGNPGLPEPVAVHLHWIFYVGNLKGVGRIYQQTAIDTYAKVGFAKLYDGKTPITAAELLNDRMLPFFEEHGIVVNRVLTDRGTEYCGSPEHHEYELYLAVEDIDHTRTKTKTLRGHPAEPHRRLALEAERRKIAHLRATGEIGDDAFHVLEEELDWLEMYIERRLG